ncbi:MAG: DUF2088 domain-containing protein [Chloroflexaceae bacterium]|nr:DUF2088 domain-containing protein [Chloroflexaceae bacterium]
MQISLNIEHLRADVDLPSMRHVRQHWTSDPLKDIAARVCEQLDKVGLRQQLKPGMHVALTAGSRGIRNIATILQTGANWLRTLGVHPFVVPAMGSHGGATAEGQLKLLEGLGITEATLGCPIRATMNVVELGKLSDGTPVYMDYFAAEADGVLIVNRIKPHTSFTGDVESGLAKMCAVGLGKQRGAQVFHANGVHGMRQKITPIARMMIERGNVLAGLAILEDATESTHDIVAVPAAEIGGHAEAELLERSKTLVARLPFDQIDVLVVDEIGKDISGTGMDTNVIGRVRIPGEVDPLDPNIHVIVALDLSNNSQGNGAGMGLADLVPAHLVQKVDFGSTYINHLTSGLIGLQRGAMPITLSTPRDAIAMAIQVCGQSRPEDVRLVRIHNTLQLEDLWVSPALLPDVQNNTNLELGEVSEWYGLEETTG